MLNFGQNYIQGAKKTNVYMVDCSTHTLSKKAVVNIGRKSFLRYKHFCMLAS